MFVLNKKIITLLLSAGLIAGSMPVGVLGAEINGGPEDAAGYEEILPEDEAAAEYAEEDGEGSDKTAAPSGNAALDDAADTGERVSASGEEDDLFARYGLVLNSDGMYEYRNENGDVQTFDPEDPELFKYFSDSDEEVVQLAADADETGRMGDIAYYSDPYQLPLDAKWYRYPSYYRTSDDSKRVGIRYGVDISKFQGVISESSWRAMKNTWGVDFAIIRAGYRGYGSSGSLNEDNCFSENIDNAYDAGVAVGVYYFSQAISRSEAEAEADHCMEIIGSDKDKVTLPVVIDYEYSGDPGRLRAAGLSPEEHTSICNAFCKRVKSKGYTPMIYANKSMLTSDMEISDIPSDYMIWMANYVNPDSSGIYGTSYGERLNSWQYTSKFTGFGCTSVFNYMKSETVDMDFWYGDFPDEVVRVTFASNGGSSVPSQTLDRGDKVVKPADPKRTGYTFQGWFKDKECTKSWNFDTDTVTKSITLYAGWKIETYTVSFISAPGEDIPPQRIDYGKKITEPVISTKPGYSLEGWFTESEYKTKWNFKNNTVKGNMILYAKITADPAEIVYQDNGGWGTVEPTKGRVDDTVTVAENSYEKTGYTYKGWNTAADGSGTPYKAGDSYVLKPGDNSLYAIWDALKYSVTFESNGGGSTGVQTVEYEKTVTEPSITPKAGCVLEGWYRDSTLTTRWDFAADLVRRDMTLYAKWEREEDPWGDLGKDENKDAKALYKELSEVPAGIWVYGVEDKDYTGTALTQDMKVFYGTRQLTSGSEYTVKYSANTKAGTAKVTITGKGNYTGKAVEEFTIRPLDLSANKALSAAGISLIYNGKVQKGTTNAAYRIKDPGGKYVTLKAGTDFTYSYPGTDSKKTDYDSEAFVGKQNAADTTDGRGYEEYIVIMTGKGNYCGQAEFTERVYAKDAPDVINVSKFKIASVPAQTLSYEGDDIKPVEPKPSIKYDGTDVPEVTADSSEDGYSLAYRDNTSAGTATIVVTGHGRYKGTRLVTFKIKDIPMSKVKVMVGGAAVSNMPSKLFTGGEITQSGYSLQYTASADSGTAVLVEGRDYSVAYTNNVNAGKNKAAMVFTGKGIYSGSMKKTFTIDQVSFADYPGRFSVYVQKRLPYTKGGTKPQTEVVYDDGKTQWVLVQGKDYNIKYGNNNAVNDSPNPKKPSTVTIDGKGNFKGRFTESFRISKPSLADTKMTASDVQYQYKSNICKPSIQIYDTNGAKLSAGSDYDKKIEYKKPDGTPVDTKEIIPVGTVITATAKGKGKYADSEVSTTFRFVAVDISKAAVKIADQYFTGKPVTLEKDDFISVKISGSEVDRSCFEIVPGSYVNNVNKGTAKVSIRGTGDWGGIKTVTFKINSAKIQK